MLDLENVLHGYLVAHDAQSALVVVVTDRSDQDARAARAEQVLAASRRIGLRTVAIVDDALMPNVIAAGAQAIIAVPTAPSLPGPLGSLLASAIALQLLTAAVVGVAGTNPDLLRREEAPYYEAVAIGRTKHPRPGS
jgi:hypothetical protein